MITLPETIKSIPTIKPLGFFVSGILLEKHLYAGMPMHGNLNLIIVVLALIFSLYKYFPAKKTHSLPSGFIYILFVFTGYNISILHKNHSLSPGEGIYLAEAASLPVKKNKSTNLKLLLRNDAQTFKPFKEKHFINAYFSSSSKRELPRPGQVILFKGNVTKVMNQGNPKEFDYAAYLSRKKVYSSCFIKDSCWEIIEIPSILSKLQKYSLEVKNSLQQYIRRIAKLKGGLDYEVMLAICTGDKSELDQDQKEAYSRVGAIHVMAVSGLHVGMIWAFLAYLTFFLRRNIKGLIIQFLLIISILWFYAFITGLSASVTRSCIMFTLASIGNLLKKNKAIFNSLFIAALIQLSLNPYLIFDAGFQFSYTAVLSILLFQPLFAVPLQKKNVILKFLMDLITVSISAQVLTFPLGAYYFHQFPVYFILTNIFVIPLVTLLMMGFLLSVLFFFIPAISENLLYLSLLITELMNGGISFIDNLPGNVIRGLTINQIQCFLLIVFEIILLRFMITRKFMHLTGSLFLLFLFISSGIYKYKKNHHDSLCIYNIRGVTAIEIHDGLDHIFFCNDSMISKNDLDYATSGYRIWKYYKAPREINSRNKVALSLNKNIIILPGDGNFMYSSKNITITVLEDHSFIRNYQCPNPFHSDILILSGKKLPQMHLLNKFFSFDKLIISSSVPEYIPDMNLSDSTFNNYHRISTKGAFVMRL